MYAVVQTGGKQYRVAEGDKLEVEKLNAEPGSTVELKAILLADGSVLTTDSDELAKAKVFAEVIGFTKGDKALVFKFKKRKGYKRLRGHRQDLTVLSITGISATGEAPKAKKEKGPAAAPKAAESDSAETAVEDEKAKEAVEAVEAKEAVDAVEAAAADEKAEPTERTESEEPTDAEEAAEDVEAAEAAAVDDGKAEAAEPTEAPQTDDPKAE